MHPKRLMTMLASANLAKAFVMPALPENKAPYALYATYAVPGTNVSIELHAQGFKGTPFHVDLDLSDWHKKHSPLSSSPMTAVGLEERDICAFFSGCSQFAAQNAVTAALFITNTFTSTCQTVYTAALDYWTANNYANLNAVIQGAVVGLAVNIVSTPIGNAIWNSKNAQTSGPDGCNVDTNKPDTANKFASSMYDFCIAIQQARSVDTNREFVFGQFDNNDNADRSVGVVVNFIAAQAGNFGPVCEAYGVTWKRALEMSNTLLALGGM